MRGVEVGCSLMSYGDTINEIPDNFQIICSTQDVKIAGYKVADEEIYGVQFHPEVYHSVDGKKIISNFIDICGCSRNWTPEAFVENSVKELKNKIGNESVIMGLSGGVDSTVAATLLHRAIGNRLHGIFIDNGLPEKMS